MIPGKQYTPELIFQILWRSRWWILLPTIAVSVAVVAWTRTLSDQSRSDAVILVVPQQVPEAYVKSTITTTVADRLQTISQQILSRTRLERIVLDLNLYQAERKSGIMEDIVDGMRDKIDVQIVKGDAFRVSFTSEDPRTAMRVTERLGSLFIDESLRDREVLAEGTNQFLEAQLEDARRQLMDNEKRLEEYRRSHNGQLPNQLESNMQGLHNTEMQLQALTDSLNRDRDRLDTVKRLITDLEANEYIQAPGPTAPVVETAADRHRAAEAALASLQLRLKADHPDVVRAKKVVADLKKAADDEAAKAVSSDDATVKPAERLRRARLNDASREVALLERDIEAKTVFEAKLRENLSAYQQRIEATPSRESELIELTRDYGTLQSMYQGLLAKKQDSQISANLERRQIGEQFRILDPARLPSRPFTPNRPRFYGLGVLAGLAVGLGVAFLLEYLDRTLGSEDDVRVAIGLPVLAAVPFIRDPGDRRRRGLVMAVLAATGAGVITAGVYAALKLVRWRWTSVYGLRERPFDLSPNPRFLFLSKRHAEALAHLRYGLTGRPGVTVLIGEAGTGKTTLVRAALEPTLGPSATQKIVRLSNPTLTRTEFYEYLSAGYGFSPSAAMSKTRFLAELEASLGEPGLGATAPVTALVVDEAQSLPHELLEEIRLLTNVQGPGGQSLTVILAGQPELANRLNEERLRQLKQRVALRCELTALDLQETAAYISTRVRVAGGTPELLFTRDAVAAIHESSQGIPRTVSVICDNALVSGYAADLKPIGREIIVEVCRDFEFGAPSSLSAVQSPAPTRQVPTQQVPEPLVPTSGSFEEPQDEGSPLFSTFTRGRRFFIF